MFSSSATRPAWAIDTSHRCLPCSASPMAIATPVNAANAAPEKMSASGPSQLLAAINPSWCGACVQSSIATFFTMYAFTNVRKVIDIIAKVRQITAVATSQFCIEGGLTKLET